MISIRCLHAVVDLVKYGQVHVYFGLLVVFISAFGRMTVLTSPFKVLGSSVFVVLEMWLKYLYRQYNILHGAAVRYGIYCTVGSFHPPTHYATILLGFATEALLLVVVQLPSLCKVHRLLYN